MCGHSVAAAHSRIFQKNVNNYFEEFFTVSSIMMGPFSNISDIGLRLNVVQQLMPLFFLTKKLFGVIKKPNYIIFSYFFLLFRAKLTKQHGIEERQLVPVCTCGPVPTELLIQDNICRKCN